LKPQLDIKTKIVYPDRDIKENKFSNLLQKIATKSELEQNEIDR